MNLIENWTSHLWKAWSVRMAYLAALPGLAWPMIPEDIRASLPPWIVTAFACAAAASIVFSRVVVQKDLGKGDGQP